MRTTEPNKLFFEHLNMLNLFWFKKYISIIFISAHIAKRTTEPNKLWTYNNFELILIFCQIFPFFAHECSSSAPMYFSFHFFWFFFFNIQHLQLRGRPHRLLFDAGGRLHKRYLDADIGRRQNAGFQYGVCELRQGRASVRENGRPRRKVEWRAPAFVVLRVYVTSVWLKQGDRLWIRFKADVNRHMVFVINY